MTALIIIAAYLVVASALGAAAAATVSNRDDMAGIAALAMFWPVTGAPMVAVMIARRIRQERSYRDEVDRRVDRELARRKEALDRENARLERELGIGGDR